MALTDQQKQAVLQQLLAAGFSAEHTSTTRNKLLNRYKGMLGDIQTLDTTHREAMELARTSKAKIQACAANLQLVEEMLLDEIDELGLAPEVVEEPAAE